MTDALSLTVAAAFGAIVGSFLNVCIYRLPRGKSIVWPASSCPRCGRALSWYENIPVVSWVALRGALPDVPRADLRPVSDRRGADGRDVRRRVLALRPDAAASRRGSCSAAR